MMKKCVLFVIAIFFISCSNDDATSKTSAMAGVWKLTSLTTENPILVNGVLTKNFTQIASNSQINFIDTTSGTISYVSSIGFFSQTINQNIEYSSTSSFVSFNFDFTKNNNLVTFYKENDETVNLVLDGNTLTMEVGSGIVLGNLDNNTTENYAIKYVFTKQ